MRQTCQCPGHAGCAHLPGRCMTWATPAGWTTSHCRRCAALRERAIGRGLHAITTRRPQDQLAHYERSSR